MINVIRNESHNFFDCHQYDYDIYDESCSLLFRQIGSRDLTMRFHSKNKKNEMIITKENYLFYKAIEKLYINIINMRIYQERLREYSNNEHMLECYKRELAMLYDGKSIIWKSDAPIEDNTKLYNYLTITKENDIYKLIFTSDMDEKNIVVEFNTDRSRYGIFVYEFCQFLYDLEDITEPFRQIEMDEYLNSKKLIKK